MSTLSSTTTGVAEGGSTTPASTAPAPMWHRFPTIARPPSTAPISIMVPSPITAPILITAPIIITALSPICTCSRIIAPGSIRAWISFLSNRGIAEFLASFSTCWDRIFSRFSSSTGRISSQSPKTTEKPLPPENCCAAGNATGCDVCSQTRTGVFLGEVRIYSMI